MVFVFDPSNLVSILREFFTHRQEQRLILLGGADEDHRRLSYDRTIIFQVACDAVLLQLFVVAHRLVHARDALLSLSLRLPLSLRLLIPDRDLGLRFVLYQGAVLIDLKNELVTVVEDQKPGHRGLPECFQRREGRLLLVLLHAA